MTKFQKIQRISSIIPFWSTIFVAIFTMIKLKRQKASKKLWAYFILTFFVSGSIVYLLNAVIMTGEHTILNVIVSGLVFAVANIVFVDLQVASDKFPEHKEKNSCNKITLICCVAGVAFVAGLMIFLMLFFAPSVDIADMNGIEDTSLGTIEMNEILSGSENYSSLHSYTYYDGEQTYVSGRMKEYDYDIMSFSCEKISGVKILQATKTQSNELTLSINSKLKAGNMEVIIIVDNQHYESIAANEVKTIDLKDIAGKSVVVIMAAESANVDVSVTRK